MSNRSIWPIDRILSGNITPGLSGLGSESNEQVLYIPQSPGITGTSLFECLVSYKGHLFGESYPSAEMQSVYFAATADWATNLFEPQLYLLYFSYVEIIEENIKLRFNDVLFWCEKISLLHQVVIQLCCHLLIFADTGAEIAEICSPRILVVHSLVPRGL